MCIYIYVYKNASKSPRYIIFIYWSKHKAFSLVKQVVADVNNADSVEDIARVYPSVSVDAFPDELNDATHELLDDASSTVAGKRAHIKEGPIKTYD